MPRRAAMPAGPRRYSGECSRVCLSSKRYFLVNLETLGTPCCTTTPLRPCSSATTVLYCAGS